ncbi:Heterokaryon incompatibility protein (HET) domain containing protein [Hyaloscypha variabilis]
MSIIYPNCLLGQQIRMLELYPGSGEEAIKTSLITSDIFNNPGFEAASYVWGDQTVRKQISCEGADITVTENLHDALLHMRFPQTPRLIWADAICINQNDLDERKQQVSLMRDIFNQASRVVVWLGRDRGENLYLAVRAINTIYQCCLDYAKSQNLSLADCMRFKDLESLPVGPNSSLDAAFNDETWSSMSHFFARQWFERIWCAQEIILGRYGIFLLETCQIPWEHIGVAAAVVLAQICKPTILGSYSRQRDKASQCISAAQIYFHRGKSTMLDNLETFHTHKATDPRDIVYGLLGLQEDGGILEPDYSKDTAEVYVDVVMATVNGNSGLKILSNVQHKDTFRHENDLPSWAPYWPRPRFVSFLARGKWHAGGQQTIDVLFPSRRELTIQGIVFEEIVFTWQLPMETGKGARWVFVMLADLGAFFEPGKDL